MPPVFFVSFVKNWVVRFLSAGKRTCTGAVSQANRSVSGRYKPLESGNTRCQTHRQILRFRVLFSVSILAPIWPRFGTANEPESPPILGYPPTSAFFPPFSLSAKDNTSSHLSRNRAAPATMSNKLRQSGFSQHFVLNCQRHLALQCGPLIRHSRPGQTP